MQTTTLTYLFTYLLIHWSTHYQSITIIETWARTCLSPFGHNEAGEFVHKSYIVKNYTGWAKNGIKFLYANNFIKY